MGVKNWLSSCQFHIWPWYKPHGGVGVTIQLSVSSPFDLDISVMVEWLLKSDIYQFPFWPWHKHHGWVGVKNQLSVCHFPLLITPDCTFWYRFTTTQFEQHFGKPRESWSHDQWCSWWHRSLLANGAFFIKKCFCSCTEEPCCKRTAWTIRCWKV